MPRYTNELYCVRKKEKKNDSSVSGPVSHRKFENFPVFSTVFRSFSGR